MGVLQEPQPQSQLLTSADRAHYPLSKEERLAQPGAKCIPRSAEREFPEPQEDRAGEQFPAGGPQPLLT